MAMKAKKEKSNVINISSFFLSIIKRPHIPSHPSPTPHIPFTHTKCPHHPSSTSTSIDSDITYISMYIYIEGTDRFAAMSIYNIRKTMGGGDEDACVRGN